MKFDLSALSGMAPISRALFRYTVYDVGDQAEMHEFRRGWNASNVTYNNLPMPAPPWPFSAAAIETLWGKRRIMEVYLNVAEWAPGVYGAEAASQHWFGKSADALTAREAARLAAILPSPRRYNAASPGPYVRRRTSRIQAAMGTVREQGLATCVLG